MTVNVTVAPFAKAVPLIVTLTVVLAGALLGVMPTILNWGVAGVRVMVGREGAEVSVIVGRAGVGVTGVAVGNGVTVTTVGVGGIDVSVKVIVGRGVTEIAKVGEGMGEAVGVIMIGLPYSLHPRSGAAPMYPVMGLAGISSPLTAVN